MLNTLDDLSKLLLSHRFSGTGGGRKTKKETFEFLDDVLARSHAWYRMRTTGTPFPITGRIDCLGSPDLTKNITDEDREAASKIREFYSKQILIWQLNGKDLSQFRKCLADFLCSPPTLLNESYAGIVYRLPEFYYYDKELCLLKETIFVSTPKQPSSRFIPTIKKLKPVVKLNRNTRSKHYAVFWYEVEGCAAKINIEIRNPLLPLWDKLFDTGQEVTISGLYFLNKSGMFEHYSVDKWALTDNLKLQT